MLRLSWTTWLAFQFLEAMLVGFAIQSEIRRDVDRMRKYTSYDFFFLYRIAHTTREFLRREFCTTIMFAVTYNCIAQTRNDAANVSSVDDNVDNDGGGGWDMRNTDIIGDGDGPRGWFGIENSCVRRYDFLFVFVCVSVQHKNAR